MIIQDGAKYCHLFSSKICHDLFPRSVDKVREFLEKYGFISANCGRVVLWPKELRFGSIVNNIPEGKRLCKICEKRRR